MHSGATKRSNRVLNYTVLWLASLVFLLKEGPIPRVRGLSLLLRKRPIFLQPRLFCGQLVCYVQEPVGMLAGGKVAPVLQQLQVRAKVPVPDQPTGVHRGDFFVKIHRTFHGLEIGFQDRHPLPHVGVLQALPVLHNPAHADHRFRRMPSTRSRACRPAVPMHGVHFFVVAGIGGRLASELVDGMFRNPNELPGFRKKRRWLT